MRRIIPINGIARIHDSVLYVKYVKHDPGAEHRKDHKQEQLNPKTLPVTDKMMLIFDSTVPSLRYLIVYKKIRKISDPAITTTSP